MKLSRLIGLMSVVVSTSFATGAFAKDSGGGLTPCNGKGHHNGCGASHNFGDTFQDYPQFGLTGIYHSNCQSIDGNFVSNIIRINATSSTLTVDVPSAPNQASTALSVIESYPIGTSIIHNLGDGYSQFHAEYRGYNFVLTASMASSNSGSVVLSGTQTIQMLSQGQVEIREMNADGAVVNQCTLTR